MCNTTAFPAPAADTSLLDWEAEWNGIETYDDLIRTNVAFLEGRMDRTPYHFGPIDPETAPLVPRLVQLNKLGFVSTNGQPVELVETRTCIYEQRSHIRGFMLAHHLPRLEAYAKEKIRDGYYFIVSSLSTDAPQVLFHTFPKRMLQYSTRWKSTCYNVTRFKVNNQRSWDKCTNVWIEPNYELRNFDDYTALTNLLAEQCIVVTVASRHYGRGSVEDVLLEFLSTL